MIKKVLIANRGEISRRIARSCRKLDIEYVTVFSDADRGSEHLEGAQETVYIGRNPAEQSYMSIEAIIKAAIESRCDAVHPGYGFLSENAMLASRVEESGLIFIGPKPETIELLGNKAKARQLIQKIGIPVLPGGDEASDSPDSIHDMIKRIGFPVILKPVAGGGGAGDECHQLQRESL